GRDLVLHLLPLVETAQPGALDRRDVNEHVPAAALGLDEAIALRRVEPLHCASSHLGPPLENAHVSTLGQSIRPKRSEICAVLKEVHKGVATSEIRIECAAFSLSGRQNQLHLARLAPNRQTGPRNTPGARLRART